jgi:protein-disulfide isomerase
VLVAAVVGGVVVAAIAVGIALAFGGKSSSASSTAPTVGSLTNALSAAADVQTEFAGIPQHGRVLGSPKAPVTMVEYVDLQCPNCQSFEATIMPTVVRDFVRAGKLKVEARPIAFIGPDSLVGRSAALAAAAQNRIFNFMQIVYFNQGTENTGWLTRDFVTQAAASVPGMKVRTLLTEMDSSAVASEGKQMDTEANADRLTGTPGIFIGRSGTKPHVLASYDEPTIAAAIKRALR